MADAKCITADRGGALYEVTCLRIGVDARTATEVDFFTVCIRAPNALTARLMARNERDDCATAFEAKAVMNEPDGWDEWQELALHLVEREGLLGPDEEIRRRAVVCRNRERQ